jgi:hypothetical protein
VSRIIPPWTFQTAGGRDVVRLAGKEYQVDTSLPPGFFLGSYAKQRLPDSWLEAQRAAPTSKQDVLFAWLEAFDAFLGRFAARGAGGEFRDILGVKAKLFAILANDLYTLDGDGKLQDSVLQRLTRAESFQGALHEIRVATTMMRADFSIDFEDETDSSRKHPEFLATHRRTGTVVAVEAKSIHRLGVLGYGAGAAPPSLETADPHKIAAQICGQVERSLPKAIDLPLYAFVDLNLPPSVAEELGLAWMDECTRILPQVDTGMDRNGVFVGKTMNLLTVTNWPGQLGEERHRGGDTLNGFLDPVKEHCRFPDASEHLADVKAAVKAYGTFPAAAR